MATNRDIKGGPSGTARSTSGRSGRGFAAMDEDKQREIARKGGKASARSQTRDEQGQFGGKPLSGAGGQGGSASTASSSRGSSATRSSSGGGSRTADMRGGSQGGTGRGGEGGSNR